MVSRKTLTNITATLSTESHNIHDIPTLLVSATNDDDYKSCFNQMTELLFVCTSSQKTERLLKVLQLLL